MTRPVSKQAMVSLKANTSFGLFGALLLLGCTKVGPSHVLKPMMEPGEAGMVIGLLETSRQDRCVLGRVQPFGELTVQVSVLRARSTGYASRYCEYASRAL